jgi:endonuclease/exonuclease/phosphatase family metal-dependent hydrolase
MTIMRLAPCLLVLVGACGDEVPRVTQLPAELKVITFNMFYGIATDVVPEDTSPEGLTPTIRAIVNALVLTEFECRLSGVARQMVAEQPDVIGLQEALQIAYAHDFDDRSDDAPVVDFTDELVRAIVAAGGPRYRAFQRDNTIIQDRFPAVGGVRILDRGAVLVHPRFAAELAGSLTYRTLVPVTAGFVPTSKDANVRGALHVRIPFESGAIDFYTTHLQSGTGDPATEAVRVAQAEELVAFIRDTASPTAVVILTGDMNDTPDSVTYAKLAPAFVDTYAVKGTPPGFTAYQAQSLDRPGNEATLRIDYIFVRAPGGVVEDSRVIFDAPVAPCNLWPSDHLGVVSRFSTGASLRQSQ